MLSWGKTLYPLFKTRDMKESIISGKLQQNQLSPISSDQLYPPCKAKTWRGWGLRPTKTRLPVSWRKTATWSLSCVWWRRISTSRLPIKITGGTQPRQPGLFFNLQYPPNAKSTSQERVGETDGGEQDSPDEEPGGGGHVPEPNL